MMRPLDLARLLRLPNVFTAMADIFLGALVTRALPENLIPFLGILLASTFLYWAGMVWNDYFDIEQDKRERPHRPLASGRVSRRSASLLGMWLILLGLAGAFVADWARDDRRWQALLLAIALTICLLLYDGWLKRTWAGPVLMGSCRFLNVLLGLSAVSQSLAPWGLALALAVGVYIMGITWFARTEARISNPIMLRIGAALMLAGLFLALTVPPFAQSAGLEPKGVFLYPYLLAAFGLVVGSAVTRAIRRPEPGPVQAAVKRALLGLIMFDAILATGLAGWIGMAILLLFLPAHFLGRWIYST